MISIRLISIGVGYILGIICATLLPTHKDFFPALFWIIMITGIIISAWTLYREFNWKENHVLLRTIPLILSAFSAANLITNSFLHSQNPGVLFFKSLPNKSKVLLQGIISAETETRSETRLDVRLKAKRVKKVNDAAWREIPEPIDVKLTVFYPPDKTQQEIVAKIADPDSYGYEIEVLGTFEKSSAEKNPGGFDYETFLMAEGYYASVKVYDKSTGISDYIKILSEKQGSMLVEVALAAKKSFLRTIQRTVPPPESFFISGATLGTRFSIKKQEYKGKLIEDMFRHSGVGHVLAVSGLHVSIVSLLLYSLFRLTRISPKYFTPFLIILLFAFAFLTGARPSSLRATIMNSLVLLFYVYGGGGLSQSAYTGLAFSSFLILLRRPMALFSAGFLLSFGAVLSLVMLTTPFDKLLRTLRGGRLIGALIWFCTTIYVVCNYWDIFLRWESIALFALLLYIFIALGEQLNKLFPFLLKINPDKLPSFIRIFIAAQLAIQVGMMIPLSSFFFGQMPVAGMFVNLLAIPLIGVIVQLGLLSGIFGSIPFIGEFIALLLGATNYLVAKLFIYIAYLGSELLPFPVTPIPSIQWLIVYYFVITLIASSPLWIRKVQTIVYRLHAKTPNLVSYILPIFLIIALGVFSAIRHNTEPSKNKELTVLASTSVPAVCITSHDYRKGAIVINGGNSFFAKSSLKSFLLKKRNIVIEQFFITSHAPDYGVAAAAELASDFTIKKLYLPDFYEPSHSELPPDFDDMEDFFSSLGEQKILQAAKEGKSWALRYYEAYVKFRKFWKKGWVLFTSPAEFELDKNVKFEYLNQIYRSFPAVTKIHFANSSVIIVPDPGSTKRIEKDKLKSQILILAGPAKNNYKNYLKPLEYLLRDCLPKTVILCVDDTFYDPEIAKTVELASDFFSSKNVVFLRTDQTGAISFNLYDGKISDHFQLYLAK